MKRRDFIKRSSLGALTAWAGSSLLVNACHTGEDMIGEPNWVVEGSFDRLLTQPPTSSTGALLNAQFSTSEILKGRNSQTLSYANGSLGPTIRANKGETMGGRNEIIASEKGWKDTVLVMPGEKVKVIMTLPETTGVFVFHCHNLEHEDDGMMLNYKIQ